MKKYISLILALFIILTSMLTVNASSTIVSTVGSSSAGGASSGGGSSGGGSGGGSSKPATPVFPYTKCNFKGTIYLPENEVAPDRIQKPNTSGAYCTPISYSVCL